MSVKEPRIARMTRIDVKNGKKEEGGLLCHFQSGLLFFLICAIHGFSCLGSREQLRNFFSHGWSPAWATTIEQEATERTEERKSTDFKISGPFVDASELVFQAWRADTSAVIVLCRPSRPTNYRWHPRPVPHGTG